MKKDIRPIRLTKGIENVLTSALRQEATSHSQIYKKHLDYYKGISDDSIPYVFAEFKRGIGKNILGLEASTPKQMRASLAQAYTCIEIMDNTLRAVRYRL
jgi:hypothetical protein